MNNILDTMSEIQSEYKNFYQSEVNRVRVAKDEIRSTYQEEVARKKINDEIALSKSLIESRLSKMLDKAKSAIKTAELQLEADEKEKAINEFARTTEESTLYEIRKNNELIVFQLEIANAETLKDLSELVDKYQENDMFISLIANKAKTKDSNIFESIKLQINQVKLNRKDVKKDLQRAKELVRYLEITTHYNRHDFEDMQNYYF